MERLFISLQHLHLGKSIVPLIKYNESKKIVQFLIKVFSTLNKCRSSSPPTSKFQSLSSERNVFSNLPVGNNISAEEAMDDAINNDPINNDPIKVHKEKKMKPREKKTVQPSLYQFKPKHLSKGSPLVSHPIPINSDGSVKNLFTVSKSSQNSNKKVVHQYSPRKLVLSHSFQSTISNFRGVEGSHNQINPGPPLKVHRYPSFPYPIQEYQEFSDR
jgi:hypothetical protein